MRERRPSDWTTDLSDRHALEEQVRAALANHHTIRLLRTNTNRFDRSDYEVATHDVAQCAIELKAKWQRYRGWTTHRPDVDERDLFILDELAMRRLIEHGPFGQLLIYDHPAHRWVIFGVVDLILAPKARVARPLRARRATTKGKVLLDLGDGHQAGRQLDPALDVLTSLIDDTRRRWAQVEPWPTPTKETA